MERAPPTGERPAAQPPAEQIGLQGRFYLTAVGSATESVALVRLGSSLVDARRSREIAVDFAEIAGDLVEMAPISRDGRGSARDDRNSPEMIARLPVMTATLPR